YVATWRQAAEEIRKALPGAILGECGFTAIKPGQTGYYVRELGAQADWITYHSHGDVTNMAQMSGLMLAVCAAAGLEHPVLFNTEMGYANWRLDQERSAAATGVQKVLYAWAHGQRGALIYCSRDIGGPRQRPRDADWGFLDYTFCPRFLYAGLAGLVDALAGCRRDAILKDDRLLHAYTFRAADRRVVALFTPDGAERDATLTSDAQAGVLVDAWGNASPLAGPRKVALTAGFLPVYVVLTGATRVTL
ncbi:MAG: hypothetical protein HYU66_15950, partial [Armatimonadetes bacterium]|nr:hypothetical protein [Armatimonadota bacterium]